MEKSITNLQWIQKGSTGCTFATLFSKFPESVGWKFFTPVEWRLDFDNKANVISIEFPEN